MLDDKCHSSNNPENGSSIELINNADIESSSYEEDDDENLIFDNILDQIVENEKKQHNKLSLSNPELTSVQLKSMFPELSDHWR